jgi:hypothetical protein
MVVIAMIASPTAQAADTTLTLACEGTKTEKVAGLPFESRNVSLSIIIDFARRTIDFGPQEHLPVELTINDLSETTIFFVGFYRGYEMGGTIDRVTGNVKALLTGAALVSYTLKCRPAQRMF